MHLYSKENTILQNLKMKINITKNKYNLDIENLFQLGARQNPKRSFLFVNNVLGKHIPVNPIIPLKLGYLLGAELTEDEVNPLLIHDLVSSINKENINNFDLKELEKFKFNLKDKTLFIGFAETATALGHSVFSSFNDNSCFVHTTREEIKEFNSSFNFEEEHSHATSHLCYVLDKHIFDNIEQIVLIDDEMSTGKTNLNLIKSLYKHFPIKKFVCMSILDWRNKEEINNYLKLEQELNIKIKVISLIKGNFECNNEKVYIEDLKQENSNKLIKNFSLNIYHLNNIESNNNINEYINFTLEKTNKEESFLLGTGKYGLNNKNNKVFLNELYTKFKKLNLCFDNRTLFMGFGEFMYIPMYIAAKFQNQDNIEFSSPSLSPIYIDSSKDYPINLVDKIQCPYDIQKEYYIYNLDNRYKQVILFLERTPSLMFINRFVNICIKKGIENVNIILGS